MLKSHPFLKSLCVDTNIRVLPDGYHISRRCDWIMYAVEAEYIDAVVKKYGPGKCIHR
jgi:prephenate dehydrogenase (NADP+)